MAASVALGIGDPRLEFHMTSRKSELTSHVNKSNVIITHPGAVENHGESS